jgi:hypothetical protein
VHIPTHSHTHPRTDTPRVLFCAPFRVCAAAQFYFSDSNLPRDKFLKGLVSKSDEGWVDFATIAQFKRMLELCPSGVSLRQLASVHTLSNNRLSSLHVCMSACLHVCMSARMHACPRVATLLPMRDSCVVAQELLAFGTWWSTVRNVSVTLLTRALHSCLSHFAER